LATAISQPDGSGGPAADGGGEGLLDGILGQPEITGQPGHHGHGPAPFPPEDDLGLRRHA